MFAQLAAVLSTLGDNSNSSSDEGSDGGGGGASPLVQVVPLLVLTALYWVYMRLVVPMASLADLAAEVRCCCCCFCLPFCCVSWISHHSCRSWHQHTSCNYTKKPCLLPCARSLPAAATWAPLPAASSWPACPPPASTCCEWPALDGRVNALAGCKVLWAACGAFGSSAGACAAPVFWCPEPA